jgi:hypothetical protein
MILGDDSARAALACSARALMTTQCLLLFVGVLSAGCDDHTPESDRLRAEARTALTKFSLMLSRNGDSLLASDGGAGTRASEFRLGEASDSFGVSLAPIGIVQLSPLRVRSFASTGSGFPSQAEARQYIYPVVSDIGVEAALLIDKTSEGYRTSAIGGSRYVTEILERRHDLAGIIGVPESAVFLTRVGALDLEYVAAERDGAVRLALVGGGPGMAPGSAARPTFQMLQKILDSVEAVRPDTVTRIEP